MPEQYSDEQILNLAEDIFGVKGMRSRHQLRVLLKKHATHGDHHTAPVYLRMQHGVGTFIEMRPSGDRKGVEFTLHTPGNGRKDFIIAKGELAQHTDTQRELIMQQLTMLHQNLHKLRSVRVVSSKEPALV